MKKLVYLLVAGYLLQVSGHVAPKEAVKYCSSFCHSHPKPNVNTVEIVQAMQNSFKDAEQKIQAALEEDKAPGGVAISFVYRDATIWSPGFGVIDMKNPDKGAPTENTGFRIGSITKVFTSLMTLILRDEGLLRSLNANVKEYLPQFNIKNPFETNRGITFRQLMSHMSGLPRAVPCEDMFETGCTLSDEEIYENLANIELLFPPGSQALYSNLGFGLLGRALEKMTGKWEDAVMKMVFEPLGFINSGNSYTEEDIAKLALGYYKDGSQANFISIGWDAPAGQTYSTVSDLGKLMMLVFSDDKPVNKSKGQILDGETIREWLQPAFIYPDTTGFSYPWEYATLGNYSAHGKDGRINGYMSQFEMVTELKTGFILLQSCDNCPSHYDIIGILKGLILEVEKQLLQLQQSPPVPANIQDYPGTYTATVDGGKRTLLINITTVNNGPILTIEGTESYLEWVEGDTFQQTLQGYPSSYNCYTLHAGNVGQKVYFQRRENGAVISLTLPGTVYGKVYKKDL